MHTIFLKEIQSICCEDICRYVRMQLLQILFETEYVFILFLTYCQINDIMFSRIMHIKIFGGIKRLSIILAVFDEIFGIGIGGKFGFGFGIALVIGSFRMFT